MTREEGGKEDMRNTAAMVRAQNDLYMVVANGGSEENAYEDNTLEAPGKGKTDSWRTAKMRLEHLWFSSGKSGGRKTFKDKGRTGKGYQKLCLYAR